MGYGGARLPRVGESELDQVRRIVSALPEVDERLSHGARCFFVAGRRALCYLHDHHNDDRVSLWCRAPPGAVDGRVEAEPHRFFRPPTSASGTFASWLGIFLDVVPCDQVDWDEITDILDEAFRCVAPKRLIAQM